MWIIGGANIDILGTANTELIEGDSNPGKIELRYGGVARNIAQKIALLGGEPIFITCFGSDHYGSLLKEDCQKLGMDISYSVEISEEEDPEHRYGTSFYLALMNHDHDMKIAMNDMEIMDRLDKDALSRAIKEMKEEDFLILDANLKEEMISYILDHAPCHVTVDPVSIAKIGKLKNHLEKIDIFKPNRIEAQHLSGMEIKDEETGKKVVRWFHNQGIKEIIITMADKGVLLGTEEKIIKLTHRPILMDNATGGGDSFLGAYTLRRSENHTPEEAVKFAITAAVMNIEADHQGRRRITEETILENINSMNIEEKEL